MPLTEMAVKKASPKEKNYKLSDEKGMFLFVMTNGRKYWRLKYRHPATRKERTLALGVYPDVSLKQARIKREDARQLLADNIDPSDHKQIQKLTRSEASANSFEHVAREWFETRMKDKSEGHQKRTMRALEKDLFAHIGRRPIADISSPELLQVLKKIEGRGAIEVARRAKQTCGQIFRFAIASGRASNDPSAALSDSLKPSRTRHFASITDPKKVGQLLRSIDNYPGTFTVNAALKLSPLLFCRPSELRCLEWSEVDFEQERIELPAEKMKMREPHIIPLAPQAMDILEEIHRVTGRFKYVFPSARGASRPLSENGVRTALRNMGYSNDDMTPHGFRAMARTLLDEVLEEKVEYIEQQLAHAVKDANGRAYNRTKHLPQRIAMMKRWADYLDGLKTQKTLNG